MFVFVLGVEDGIEGGVAEDGIEVETRKRKLFHLVFTLEKLTFILVFSWSDLLLGMSLH